MEEAHRWAHLRLVGFSPMPTMGYNFVVSLLDTSSGGALAKSIIFSAVGDVAIGGFQECTGLDLSLTMEDYREGGRNSEMLHFPTRSEWGQITLKKGVGALTSLWDWSYSFVEGKGQAARRPDHPADRPAHPEQHLVLPPRTPGEVHGTDA